MNLITWAVLLLAVFIAIWFFIVVPAEKRHHERKLKSLQDRIEKRRSRQDEETGPGAPDNDASTS